MARTPWLILGVLNVGLIIASTITAPPSPAPTSALSFRNPLIAGYTFDFASVNGTTTIWAASYTNPANQFDQTDEGTVTDIGTDLMYRETREWNTAGGETYSATYSCHVNATRLCWCNVWGSSVVNGTTKAFPNETLDLGALSPVLYTMTVENNTLVPLNTRTQSTPVATKSQSSKLIPNLRH
jgi:hypothetical protein